MGFVLVTQDYLQLNDDDLTLRNLPQRVDELCAVVQGLLIHDAGYHRYYGTPPDRPDIDRTTRPVAERIARILDRDPKPLTIARSPFRREIGTCRDFAIMLCAFIRQSGTDARVRCGFADYLGGGHWEDHWVCDYGSGSDWHLADAQMDAEHCAVHKIDFPIHDVPRDRFLTADAAWLRWRSGGADPGDFGHGATRGQRFLLINIVRDALAREDWITSDWDRWREAERLTEPLNDREIACGDEIASGNCESNMPSLETILAPAS